MSALFVDDQFLADFLPKFGILSCFLHHRPVNACKFSFYCLGAKLREQFYFNCSCGREISKGGVGSYGECD